MIAKKDGGALDISNNQGKTMGEIVTTKAGGKFEIFNNRGKPIWSAP